MPFAAETPEFLGEIAALVCGGAAVAYLAYRVRLVPIVGFLLAGVLIGPNQLGVVADRDLVDAAAEVGVILLLFTIGLEYSLDRLARIWRTVFLGGGLQVTLATGATTAILLAAGVEARDALFTGMLVSLSSTAIVLKVLAERGKLNTRPGQAALGLLLFQDLAIVLMVLLVPAISGEGGSTGEVALALLKAVAIVAAVVVVARRLMPEVLERVAGTCSPEVFLLTVVAILFGTAYLTSLAGVSVSLGAFLAGLLVSESRFDQQALGDILPLQMVFSALFFLSVGMLLDLGFVVDHLPAVIGAVAAVFLLKVVTTGLACRLGSPRPAALATALALAQVGEFSFVLMNAGGDAGLTPAGLGADGQQVLIAATVLLMFATPWMIEAGFRTGMRLKLAGGPITVPEGSEPEAGTGIADDLDGHVIVSGYGRYARLLTHALQRSGVPFVLTTLSPDGAAEAAERGIPVLLGDSTRTRTLLEAGIARASFVVIPDDEPAMAARIAGVARSLSPEAKVVARARYRHDAAEIAAAGAHVVTEEAEASARLFYKVLTPYDVQPDQIEELVAELRQPGLPSGRRAVGFARGRTVVDTEQVVEPNIDPDACPHVAETRPVQPSAPGCEECLRIGDVWVHLRICMTCGHVGCCDSSPHRHARRHWEQTGHAIIRSAEPGEDWAYCFEDGKMLPLVSAEPVGEPG